MERLTLTADGSCLGNPGPGGWAWVFDELCWAAGSHPRTTNNLMELRAVYEALNAAPHPYPILLQTDSSYVINVFTVWLPRWESTGWKTSDKKPVANQRSIELVRDALRGRDVDWLHVRGHAGHVENELADRHARAAATAQQGGARVMTGNPGCLRLKAEQAPTPHDLS